MPFTQSQISDIKDLIKETMRECMCSEEFMATLAGKVEQKICAGIDKKLAERDDKINALVSDGQRLSNKISSMEQAKRKKNVRIYGVKERKDETISSIMALMKFGLDESTVKYWHRMGKAIPKKERPILIKFNEFEYKLTFISDRRKLKGSGMVITDDLIKERHDLLKSAAEKLGRNKVWSTANGKIMACINGEKIQLNSIQDIENLHPDDGQNSTDG